MHTKTDEPYLHIKISVHQLVFLKNILLTLTPSSMCGMNIQRSSAIYKVLIADGFNNPHFPSNRDTHWAGLL